jgi:hypothetical protein
MAMAIWAGVLQYGHVRCARRREAVMTVHLRAGMRQRRRTKWFAALVRP